MTGQSLKLGKFMTDQVAYVWSCPMAECYFDPCFTAF